MPHRQALEALQEGNARFVERRRVLKDYTRDDLREMASGQSPMAAVVACADSRVCPEVVFDQPLGAMFVSRVPANVASDSAKWMIDIAVGEFHVPLVVVLAHTNCLAVKQIVEGRDGPGGLLRYRVQCAYNDSCRDGMVGVYERTIDENARKTCRDLAQESYALHDALRARKTVIVPARYDIATGEVVWLDPL